jgi:hypothetical protein
MIVRALVAGGCAGLFAIGLSASGCSSSSSPTDAGDAMTTTETGPADVVTEKAPKDTGPDVAMVMCPQPKTDLSMFMPPMSIPPPNASTDSCTSMQLSGYWTACRDTNATSMTCNAWRMANMACAGCLESTDTDASWGPLVYGSGQYVTNGTVRANYEGCLVKLGYQACADASFRQGLCTKFACEEQCPVMDNTSYQEYVKCTNTANTGVCKMYTDKVTMTCAADAAPNLAACRGNNFQDFFNKIAPIFCSAGG